ncbi:hypothetical protein [Christiangramia salexigens]|uniref:NIPSNAP protein n=1 Tax=Christiangramia salexigens TaxID=1913577 RepID=A0A1L3J7L2_9FLAO|nr:hypothetical protein [Christiangramia salexigens]APG61109.1 hypothetical protein LPB144_12165 [Christiangramia salexigens]
MKTISKLLIIAILLSLSGNVMSQDQSQEEFTPVYITMTKTYWSDDPDLDRSDWLKVEKEYFDKVTKKNELIMSSGFYTHYFTGDNSEVLLVNVYRNWADIEMANEINQALIEEAWPDEKERKAFFDKQSSYYSADHSDEIYSTMRYMIPELPDNGKSRIFYIRSSNLAMDGKGSPAKFREYYEKVTKKSKNLKGYYTHRHLWGANSREMNEVFVFDKLADIETFFEEEQELVATSWTDEKERSAFLKEMGLNFTGKHGDYIYRNIPELRKTGN